MIYIYFIKPSSPTAALVSSSPTPTVGSTVASSADPLVAQEFLTLLLSVKNIKLDDTIFSDRAFNSLHDSSITLIPDGTEGRPNPFAPIGTDVVAPPVNAENPNTTTGTTAGASMLP